MAWIDWVDGDDATGPLAEFYKKYAGAHGIDHILKIHSLNPKALDNHALLYSHIMRGPSKLSRAEREMIAVVVSKANECFY